MKIKILFCFLLFAFLVGCKKDTEDIQTGSIRFKIQYVAGSQQLQFDTLAYQNAAGNNYSVTNLEYYISDVVLLGEDGTKILRKDVFYLNAEKPQANTFAVAGVERKKYIGLNFKIGLNADTNKTGFLPPVIDNLNMFWPDPMGGGYHFLKLEGNFLDSLSDQMGYAMHLGTNSCVVYCSVQQDFLLTGIVQEFILVMNVSEWFENPNTYDLNAGSYIMGNQGQMQKIAQNGIDVFSLQ